MIHLLSGQKAYFEELYMRVLGECIGLPGFKLNSESKKQKKMEGHFYHWPSIIERRCRFSGGHGWNG